jgi:thymidylate kinase
MRARELEQLISTAGPSTDHAQPLPPPDLEGLAHELALAFRTERRPGRPFLIELAGTPRAGKTTAMTALTELLRAQELHVETVTERAVECPMKDKRHPYYNVWTSCRTLELVLEAQDRTPDFVLVDRGLYDAACWMEWYRSTGILTGKEHQAIERFVLLPRWARVIGLVAVMRVDPDVAIERERAQSGAQAPSQIINSDTLGEFNESLRRVRRRRRDLPLVELDTSRAAPDEVVRSLLRTALDRMRHPASDDEAGGWLPRAQLMAGLLVTCPFLPWRP